MNIKALITTLVLGSSTMASADSFTVSASAKVSLGFNASSAPVIVRDHRLPAPVPTPVVVDPCATTATPIAPAAYRPAQLPPVWSGPLYYHITNTNVSASGSGYAGWMANSPLMQTNYDGRVVLRPTRLNTWFDFTEATRIDSGREIFKVGTDNGWFRAIKLQNMGSRGSTIFQVKIEFADGGKGQLVKLDNQRLDAAHSSIAIDLDGNYRQISRIIVYGSTDAGAAYKLQAL